MPLSIGISRVYELIVTVPAGTPVANPVAVPWVTEDAVITDIEVLIPSGPNGTTGVRVMKGDIQLLPWSRSSWIIGNDYNRVFPIGGYLPTSDIKVQAYNIGQNPHNFYLRMTVTDTAAVSSTVQTGVIDLSSLGQTQGTADPLSPEAILGTQAVGLLSDGTITAADLAPVPPDLPTPSVTDVTTQPPTI